MQATGDGPAALGRVLLVDDDEAVVRLTTRLLERLGYQVQAFTQAEAALDTVLGSPSRFDAVLTDFRMPGMTGREFLSRIREAGVSIPALIISGFAAEVEQHELSALGLGPVLEKPFTKVQIRDRLAELLTDTHFAA